MLVSVNSDKNIENALIIYIIRILTRKRGL